MVVYVAFFAAMCGVMCQQYSYFPPQLDVKIPPPPRGWHFGFDGLGRFSSGSLSSGKGGLEGVGGPFSR
jgi:hypothetical protein